METFRLPFASVGITETTDQLVLWMLTEAKRGCAWHTEGPNQQPLALDRRCHGNPDGQPEENFACVLSMQPWLCPLGFWACSRLAQWLAISSCSNQAESKSSLDGFVDSRLSSAAPCSTDVGKNGDPRNTFFGRIALIPSGAVHIPHQVAWMTLEAGAGRGRRAQWLGL